MAWTCPFCQHVQTPTSAKLDIRSQYIDIDDSALGHFGVRAKAVGCSNPDCKQVELKAELIAYGYSNATGPFVGTNPTVYQTWRLLPESSAKPWPDYIPQQIRDDYREACLVQTLSPKASATLARRCLQGMIRDFGQVKPGHLFHEIDRLADAVRDGTAPRDVSIDSIAALTSVRKIGNIGAHMEADVDLIVSVDESEAQELIGLLELLLEEWYVERHKRTARFSRIGAIEAEKAKFLDDAKAALKSPPARDGEPKGQG